MALPNDSLSQIIRKLASAQPDPGAQAMANAAVAATGPASVQLPPEIKKPEEKEEAGPDLAKMQHEMEAKDKELHNLRLQIQQTKFDVMREQMRSDLMSEQHKMKEELMKREQKMFDKLRGEQKELDKRQAEFQIAEAQHKSQLDRDTADHDTQIAENKAQAFMDIAQQNVDQYTKYQEKARLAADNYFAQKDKHYAESHPNFSPILRKRIDSGLAAISKLTAAQNKADTDAVIHGGFEPKQAAFAFLKRADNEPYTVTAKPGEYPEITKKPQEVSPEVASKRPAGGWTGESWDRARLEEAKKNYDANPSPANARQIRKYEGLISKYDKGRNAMGNTAPQPPTPSQPAPPPSHTPQPNPTPQPAPTPQPQQNAPQQPAQQPQPGQPANSQPQNAQASPAQSDNSGKPMRWSQAVRRETFTGKDGKQWSREINSNGGSVEYPSDMAENQNIPNFGLDDYEKDQFKKYTGKEWTRDPNNDHYTFDGKGGWNNKNYVDANGNIKLPSSPSPQNPQQPPPGQPPQPPHPQNSQQQPTSAPGSQPQPTSTSPQSPQFQNKTNDITLSDPGKVQVGQQRAPLLGQNNYTPTNNTRNYNYGNDITLSDPNNLSVGQNRAPLLGQKDYSGRAAYRRYKQNFNNEMSVMEQRFGNADKSSLASSRISGAYAEGQIKELERQGRMQEAAQLRQWNSRHTNEINNLQNQYQNAAKTGDNYAKEQLAQSKDLDYVRNSFNPLQNPMDLFKAVNGFGLVDLIRGAWNGDLNMSELDKIRNSADLHRRERSHDNWWGKALEIGGDVASLGMSRVNDSVTDALQAHQIAANRGQHLGYFSGTNDYNVSNALNQRGLSGSYASHAGRIAGNVGLSAAEAAMMAGTFGGSAAAIAASKAGARALGSMAPRIMRAGNAIARNGLVRAGNQVGMAQLGLMGASMATGNPNVDPTNRLLSTYDNSGVSGYETMGGYYHDPAGGASYDPYGGMVSNMNDYQVSPSDNGYIPPGAPYIPQRQLEQQAQTPTTDIYKRASADSDVTDFNEGKGFQQDPYYRNMLKTGPMAHPWLNRLSPILSAWTGLDFNKDYKMNLNTHPVLDSNRMIYQMGQQGVDPEGYNTPLSKSIAQSIGMNRTPNPGRSYTGGAYPWLGHSLGWAW